MKTFKLCSLTLPQDGTPFQLIDGLIINKENEGKYWLIEAMLENDATAYFHEALAKKAQFNVSAIITNPTNQPVMFTVNVRSIAQIGTKSHVLLDGKRAEKD